MYNFFLKKINTNIFYVVVNIDRAHVPTASISASFSPTHFINIVYKLLLHTRLNLNARHTTHFSYSRVCSRSSHPRRASPTYFRINTFHLIIFVFIDLSICAHILNILFCIFLFIYVGFCSKSSHFVPLDEAVRGKVKETFPAGNRTRVGWMRTTNDNPYTTEKF